MSAVDISEFGGEFRLKAKLAIEKPIDEVFEFFSQAKNLEALTPPSLQFNILNAASIEMKQDEIINYKLKVRGVPVKWRSLISAWEPPAYFVDEQLVGPYRYWIHRHSFREEGASTIVEDFVRYQVIGGKLVHKLFVKPDLLKIFRYRQAKLQELFL